MFQKSTWLHLRIPFSFFLLPVFLFSLCISQNINGLRLFVVFVCLHIFLYPASNGYNSYFDRDEGSIGGLKNPPPVHRGLYGLSLAFDIIALALGSTINGLFVLMLLVYGLVSKAYSHPIIRLKKYPWSSWFIVGLFQGAFTFVMVYIGVNDYALENLNRTHVYLPALLSSLLLWGSYPTTQIYQHEEDARRRDNTLSRVLGIKGTLHFTAIVFTLSTAGFFCYFEYYFSIYYSYLFLLFLSPVLLFFGYWYLRVHRNSSTADYQHTMWLSSLSALCLNAFFLFLFLKQSQLWKLYV